MVPNSPGGGYDLTARTAVKIMEDDDITGSKRFRPTRKFKSVAFVVSSGVPKNCSRRRQDGDVPD